MVIGAPILILGRSTPCRFTPKALKWCSINEAVLPHVSPEPFLQRVSRKGQRSRTCPNAGKKVAPEWLSVEHTVDLRDRGLRCSLPVAFAMMVLDI
jgi:hypothetical protein